MVNDLRDLTKVAKQGQNGQKWSNTTMLYQLCFLSIFWGETNRRVHLQANAKGEEVFFATGFLTILF